MIVVTSEFVILCCFPRQPHFYVSLSSLNMLLWVILTAGYRLCFMSNLNSFASLSGLLSAVLRRCFHSPDCPSQYVCVLLSFLWHNICYTLSVLLCILLNVCFVFPSSACVRLDPQSCILWQYYKNWSIAIIRHCRWSCWISKLFIFQSVYVNHLSFSLIEPIL